MTNGNNHWYYQIMGETVGPVSGEQLVDAVVEGRVNLDTFVRRNPSEDWTSASKVKGLFEKAANIIEQRREAEEARKAAEIKESQNRLEKAQRDQERYEKMKISTCSAPPNRSFEILDTVFAIFSDGDAGAFSASNGSFSSALQQAIQHLRKRAFDLGADAIINCSFSYQTRVVANTTGSAINSIVSQLSNTNPGMSNTYAQAVEVFGYGTAIRFTDNASQAVPQEYTQSLDDPIG